MTVKEYREQLKLLDDRFKNRDENGGPLSEVMVDSMELWSNDAVLGYVTMAAEKIGADQDTITSLVSALRRAFDDVTVDEAIEHYQNR